MTGPTSDQPCSWCGATSFPVGRPIGCNFARCPYPVFAERGGIRHVHAQRLAWYAIVNDLIGGWCVSTISLPLSAHDHRADGDSANCGYVIADCMTKDDAEVLADLLNGTDYMPADVVKNPGRWALNDRIDAIERLHQITNGIDQEELSAPGGWWETSTGAAFGADVLRQLEGLITDLLSPENGS